MAKLYFKVASDWEEVVRLRNEIAKLKQELKGMDSTQSPAAFNTLNAQLSASTKKMDELVTEAAKAGAVMQGDFKKKIFDASQVVNGFTEKIIAQKAVVKDVEADVKRLGEAYRNAKKNNPWGANTYLSSYNSARKALDEEKAALFSLTQEQAKARLSVKQLRDEYALYRDDSKETVVATEGIGFSLKKAFAVIGGAALGKQLISDMIRVRGEFQAADTAIQTLLGSKEKADALMSQVREYAKISPLEFSDVTAATQMMLGFNIEAEKVPRFLQAIGDVSMGDTQKFNSLTLAFSQMSATGKLMGQDLNQMINAGFNPLQSIADRTGKSIATLKEEMSKGAISAEMVQQAFIDATSAGGKFYNMSENASKTINGQISMMQDAMDSAFNEIGQKSEGIIMSGIQMTTTLIENYETVGKVLAGLVVTYGTYRAALIANIALTRSWAVAARADAVAKGIQTAATKAATIAQAAFNAVANANPYVLLTTAVVGLGAAMLAFSDSATAAEKAEERYNEEKNKTIEAERKHTEEIEKLINISGDESLSTENRRLALVKLEQKFPDIFKKYDTYYEKLAHIRDIKQEILELDGKNSITNPQNEIAIINKRIEELNRIEKTRGSQYAGTSSAGVAIYSQAGLSAKEIAERQMLLRKRQQLTNQVQKDNANEYLKNLTGVSNADLDKQIKERENLLAKMSLSDKKYGKVKKGGGTGIYNKDELQGQIQLLQSEKKRRTEGQKETKQSLADKKKELSAQLDALSEQEAAGKKGLEIKKKIAEYDKRLEAYSTKSSSSDKASKQQASENKANDDLLKLQMENRKAQLDLEEETTEKKLKLIDLSYDKQKAEIEKKERELAEQNKKSGTKGLNEKGLTAEQQAEIDKAYEINNKSREKQISDVYKEEFASMREYLKEYGSFQQQKLAIAEEYAQKIADVEASSDSAATKEWKRKRLDKERMQKEASLSFENISRGIDWHALFSGVGNLTKEIMSPMMDQLQAWVKTDEYRNAGAETQQKVTELIQEMRRYVGTDQSVTWQTLDKAIKDFAAAVAVYDKAKKDEEAAVRARDEGKARLAAGKIDKSEYKELERKANELGDATVKAREDMEAFGDALNRTSDEVANFTSGLTTALSNAKGWTGAEGFGGIQSAVGNIDQLKGTLDSLLPQMGDGMAKTLGTTLSGTLGSTLGSIGSSVSSLLSSGLGSVIGIVAQIPRLILDLANNIKQFVTGVLDSLTELISIRWIDDLVVSILDAIGNLIDAIFDLPENLYKVIESIVVDGVGGLLNTILGRIGNILSFGALSHEGPSEWFTNSNAKEVADTIERLTEENKNLEQSIEDLKDEMEKSRGASAIDISRRAADLQEETNANYKEIAQAQARYHSAHNSWNYYWGGFDNEQVSSLSKQIGRNWSGNIWDLSPEEMKMLRSNVDMWEQIQKTGKGGYGERVAEKLNDYIDQAGKLQEITDALYENLTTTTKENVFDDFLNSLYDLADGSEEVFDDIEENWQKMVNKMVINNLVGAKFQKRMEEWYENLAKLNEAKTKGEITTEEYRKRLEALKEEYERYINDANRDVEIFRNEGIIKSTDNKTYKQEATQKGFQAISQDVGEEINGRFTALQISGEEIKNQNTIQTQSLNILTMKVEDMFSVQTDTRNIANETRDIIANSYLELQEIRENTGAIIKPIQQMQKDIAEVKRNTSRL